MRTAGSRATSAVTHVSPTSPRTLPTPVSPASAPGFGTERKVGPLSLERRLTGVGDAELEGGEDVGEAAVGGLRLVELLGRELQRAPVVRGEEVGEHHRGLVAVEHLSQEEDVAHA